MGGVGRLHVTGHSADIPTFHTLRLEIWPLFLSFSLRLAASLLSWLFRTGRILGLWLNICGISSFHLIFALHFPSASSSSASPVFSSALFANHTLYIRFFTQLFFNLCTTLLYLLLPTHPNAHGRPDILLCLRHRYDEGGSCPTFFR
jgi:hypothetical protein